MDKHRRLGLASRSGKKFYGFLFWAIMYTKQQKTKTKGIKKHIQVRKLVEDIEKSKKRSIDENSY